MNIKKGASKIQYQADKWHVGTGLFLLWTKKPK